MLKIKKQKNLVISTVGDHSLHKFWIKSKNYDTFLIYFGNNNLFQNESNFINKQKDINFI